MLIQIAAIIIAAVALLWACMAVYYARKAGRQNREARAHWEETSARINRGRR